MVIQPDNVHGQLESAVVYGLSAALFGEITVAQGRVQHRPVLRPVHRLAGEEPRPRLPDMLSDPSVFGALAREVVERYGDAIMEHPVGTGPYKVQSFDPGTGNIVLIKNPDYTWGGSEPAAKTRSPGSSWALVTGIPIRWISVRPRPMAMGAKLV